MGKVERTESSDEGREVESHLGAVKGGNVGRYAEVKESGNLKAKVECG